MDGKRHSRAGFRPELLPGKAVDEITGMSRAYRYDLIARRKFPAPAVRIGTRYTRWLASDVQSWIADPQGWMDAHAPAEAGVQA